MRQKRQILKEIKKGLEKEGLQTSQRDPLFVWMHDMPSDRGGRENEIGNTLYILEPPVPKISPFDLAAISLRIDRDHLSFALSLYYIQVLENVVDAETINEIYDRHALKWSPAFHTFFSDIAKEFSMTWDTEHDAYIEDSLRGAFPIDSSPRIVEVMNAIKRHGEQWKQ